MTGDGGQLARPVLLPPQSTCRRELLRFDEHIVALTELLPAPVGPTTLNTIR